MAAASTNLLLDLTPRLIPGQRWQNLPLTPQEGFILSRIDDRSPASLLVAMTGLPTKDVIAALERLEALGAIAWTRRPGEAAAVQATDQAASPAPGDAALVEACDLSMEEKQAILEMEHRVEAATYWELLGVDGTGSAAEAKRSYFALSRQFHPDRYFGKELGSFRGRLERIFRAVKQAHEVLADASTRAAYTREHPPPARTSSVVAPLETVTPATRVTKPTPAPPSAERPATQPTETPAGATAAATTTRTKTTRTTTTATMTATAAATTQPSPSVVATSAGAATAGTDKSQRPASRTEPGKGQQSEEQLEAHRQAIIELRRVRAKPPLYTPHKAASYHDRGHERLAAGDPAGAALYFELAAAHDPARHEYRRLCEEARAQAAQKRGSGGR